MSGSQPKNNIPYGGEVSGRRLGDTNTQIRREDSSMASDDDSLESKLIIQNKKLLQTVKELESVLSQRKNEEQRIEQLENENEYLKMQIHLKEAEERIANERQPEAGNNQITGLRKDLAKKEEEIAKLNKYLSDKERKIKELQTKDKTSDLKKKEKEVEKLDGDLSNAMSKLKEKKEQLEAANHEIEELKTRLSKVMGANITDNNPDIAELGDPNRPTKLAERYSELYDFEWTVAYEEIERNGVKEVDVIKRLFDSLKDVCKFCNQVSVNWTKNIEASALLIPGTDNGRPNTENLPATSRKQITDFRKAIAPSLSGDVFKQYLKTTRQSLDKCPQTKKYIKACVDLCWLMSIQDPPVVLDLEDPRGPFDGAKYKTYTRTGKTLAYVVWPPLRLHDGGGLLSKGVAQGK